jgi:hypothetical protein
MHDAMHVPPVILNALKFAPSSQRTASAFSAAKNYSLFYTTAEYRHVIELALITIVCKNMCMSFTKSIISFYNYLFLECSRTYYHEIMTTNINISYIQNANKQSNLLLKVLSFLMHISRFCFSSCKSASFLQGIL